MKPTFVKSDSRIVHEYRILVDGQDVGSIRRITERSIDTWMLWLYGYPSGGHSFQEAKDHVRTYCETVAA